MRALFIDLDGTLADSLTFLYDNYCTFVSSYGGTPSAEEFQELNGPPLSVGMRLLQKRHPIPGDPDQLAAAFLSRAEESYGSIGMVAGADQFLRWAHETGYQLGLVTSGPHASSRAFLVRHSVEHLFSFLVTAEDVLLGKPDPEPYLLALERSSVAASEALVIEDAAKGVAAARAAGITCVWLGGDALDNSGASLCVSSWNQLTPLVIDELFHRKTV